MDLPTKARSVSKRLEERIWELREEITENHAGPHNDQDARLMEEAARIIAQLLRE